MTEVFSHLATGATAPLALSDSPTATLPQHPAAAGRGAPPPAFSTFGRFELLEVLGEGGFGMVFRARDPQLDREVAIKIPKEGVLSRPEDRERFIREGQAAATVQHPNLCPVYEAGEVDGRPYIVMALIEGQPLSKVLERSGRIPERSAAATIRKLAAALQAAHQKGIIHRDLKPSNVIIDRKGQPVIMDFGLSRRLDPNVATLTQSGAILGTPAYMAPEQALAQAAQIGPATDVYALGMILYEMLAGERPFTGDLATVLAQVASVEPKPPSALRPDVDPRLEAICLKAISKNIADRYRSMRELAAALGEYLKATDPAAKTVQTAVETREIAALVTGMQSQLTTLAKKQRGTWWKWMAGSAVTAALVVAALFFFWGSREPRTQVKLKFVEPYLADTSLSYFLDSKPVTADALATPVTLAVGDHLLEIKRQVFVIKQFMFTVAPDQSEIVTADAEYPPPTPPLLAMEIPPPVARWTLDGDPATALHDVTGTTAAPKELGAVGWSWRAEGRAATFDGNDALLVPDHERLRAKSAVTISAWVCPDETKQQGRIAGKSLPSPDYVLTWSSDASEYQFGVGVGSDAGVQIGAWGVAGQWTHVAGIFDGERVLLYIDGQLANRQDLERVPTIRTAKAARALGKSLYELSCRCETLDIGRQFQGAIDDVRVWDVALTAEQVSYLAKRVSAQESKRLAGTKPRLKMKFCWCPPGEFTMGSPREEPDRATDGSEDQVQVKLSKGFRLGKYEVTQAQWKRVMDSQPWSGKGYVKEGDDCPASYVSWEDATKFCEELTRQERAAGRLPADWEYRLPTEAQWEYACRAGGTKRFHFGDDESELRAYAWFWKNAVDVGENYAHEVGGKRANDWGLHDMHGNVWEWCRDWYKDTLPGGTDPEMGEKASERVLRGGAWWYGVGYCRSAHRGRYDASFEGFNRAGEFEGFNRGFRVAAVQSGK